MLILYYVLMTSFLKTVESDSRLDFKFQVAGSNLTKSIIFAEYYLCLTVFIQSLLTSILIVEWMYDKEPSWLAVM